MAREGTKNQTLFITLGNAKDEHKSVGCASVPRAPSLILEMVLKASVPSRPPQDALHGSCVKTRLLDLLAPSFFLFSEQSNPRHKINTVTNVFSSSSLFLCVCMCVSVYLRCLFENYSRLCTYVPSRTSTNKAPPVHHECHLLPIYFRSVEHYLVCEQKLIVQTGLEHNMFLAH